jgi:hypothetical protein
VSCRILDLADGYGTPSAEGVGTQANFGLVQGFRLRTMLANDCAAMRPRVGMKHGSL